MTSPTDRRAALLAVTLAAFLTAFTGSSVNIALPAIGKDFALNAVTLGWVPTAYLLASAIVLLPAGRLADIYGRKRVFLRGAAVFGLASLLVAMAPSAPALIIFRIVQGMGGAMMFSTSVAILTSVYPPQEKGRALGFNVAAVYVGLSVGPTLGGFLTQQFGWRSIFYINTPLAAFVTLLIAWKLKGEWAEARGESFDVGGSLLYGLSLFSVIYGFSTLPAPLGAGIISMGLVGFIVFVAWESRLLSPVLNIGLFRNNAVFAFSNLAALINYCASSATGFLLSLYLQQVKGLTPQAAGLVMVAQPVMQAIFSPITGRLSDSVEPRLLASLGMAFNAVGLFLFASMGEQTPIAFVVFNLVLMGLGFALFSSPNTNAVMSSVDRRVYGVASAALSTMRVIGQTLSIGIAVLIFALIIGRVAITPEITAQFLTSTRVIFSIFGVLCVAGIVASLARGNLR